MNLPGAAKYISGSQLVTCKRCGCTRLGWATSTKTGRSYLANTQRSHSDRATDAYVVQPWAPHNCDEHRARVAADEKAAADKAARDQAAGNELADMIEANVARLRADGHGTPEQLAALLAEAARLRGTN